MSWFSRSRSAVSSSKSAKPARRTRLSIELLEDRLTPSTLLPYTNRHDMVYDSVHNQLDVVTTDGRVLVVNPQTMQVVNAFNVGANLHGADISPDGRYLYVTDAGIYGTAAYLRRLDLNTMAIANLSYARATGENGGWDVAVANNGKGLFDGMATAAYAPVPVHQITLSTNQITTRTDAPGIYGGGRLPANSLIQRSADRSLFLFLQAGNTGGSIFTYNANTNTFTPGPSIGPNLTNAQSAVNRNGSLIAIEVPGGLLIMDSQFHQINFLQGLDGGVTFDPTKDVMYAVSASQGQIYTFNTNTWAVQGQMAVGESTGPGQAYGNGVMTVSADGHWLFLATPSGVREYTLFNPNPPTHFGLSNYAPYAIAGTPNTFTITALDQFNSVASSYAGTVHININDPQVGQLPDYTFTAADAGVHTFTATFKTAGSQMFAVYDLQYSSSLYAYTNIQVFPGALAAIKVTAPSPDPTGYAFSTTFSARDAYNNIIPNYTGKIHVTSNDDAAVLPPDYTFTANDNGLHSLPVTINTPGNQTIKATDTNNSAITGTTTVLVGNYVPGLHFTATSSSPTVAVYAPYSYTVTALDTNNQVGVHYNGTIHFQSSDPNAVLPADYTFTDADHGVHTFSITLKKVASSSWVSFADQAYITYGNGATVSENVVPAPATSFVVTGWPTGPVTAGTSSSITMTAMDPYGNIATNYTGTVHFSTTDAQVVPPADYTFVAGDHGVHTVSITLKTAGNEYFAIQDINNPNLAYSTAPVTVTPGAMAGFHLIIQPAVQAAGYIGYPMVFASDAYYNVITNYTGTVHYTSSDPAAALPEDHTFAASDNGLHSFAMVFETPGTQTLTATDTTNPAITGTGSLEVGDYIPGLHFSVETPFWIYNAGQSFSATITALDQYNQVATNYHGTVVLSSNDLAAGVVLPANYTFTADDAGVHTFTGITLVTRRKGSDPAILRVTDPDNGAGGPGTGATLMIINALAPSSFSVTGFPASTTAASPATFTVSARDIYGNISDWYHGTVHFTSSDPQAVLPADYAFTYSSSGPSDQGVHTFTATLGTAGVQSISANAVASPSVAGSQDGITVTPAAAYQISISYPANVTAGTPFSLIANITDQYGNVIHDYAGTLHFASTDPEATLPADYTMTAADDGSYWFEVTFWTPGTQTLSVTDLEGLLVGMEMQITVS